MGHCGDAGRKSTRKDMNGNIRGETWLNMW
jgi:hypothetical protein